MYLALRDFSRDWKCEASGQHGARDELIFTFWTCGHDGLIVSLVFRIFIGVHGMHHENTTMHHGRHLPSMSFQSRILVHLHDVAEDLVPWGTFSLFRHLRLAPKIGAINIGHEWYGHQLLLHQHRKRMIVAGHACDPKNFNEQTDRSRAD